MIEQLIEEWAPKLNTPEALNPYAILWAIFRCEHYSAGNRIPRFEPVYAPGGYYYEQSAAIRALYEQWGEWAAKSYSNFQIMYPTAVELGYEGPPLGLNRDEAAIEYVVRLLNRRIFANPGDETAAQVADAYNSGNFKDGVIPEKYIAKFEKFYVEGLKKWPAKK